jgi:ribosomal 50S subunit-recycling heat shock protein
LRVDLYLKLMGITKTRMAAKRLCDSGRVSLEGKALKPSEDLKGGEMLLIFLPLKEVRLTVVGIPPGKSVAKSDRRLYVSIATVDRP